MTTLGEQPRGEDGRFAAQPPQGGDPTADARADRAGDAGAASQERETAPASPAAASDPYQTAATEVLGTAENLDSGTVVPDRRPPDPAPTPPSTPAAPGPAAEAPPPSPSDPAAPVDPVVAADAVKAYAGQMSANTHALLKSVPGGLPDPDEWAAMDSTERADHVVAVKAFRNAQKRDFNNQAKTAPAPPAAAEPTEAGRPPSAPGTRDAGVQLPPDVRAHLDALAADVGTDSNAYLAIEALFRRDAEREADARQTAERAAGDRQVRAFEDGVFDQLETRYPALSDPRKRDELRQTCRDWFLLKRNRGEDVRDADVIRDVVHRSLFSDTKKLQETRDGTASAKLRAGSFDRGAPSPPRAKAPAAGGDPYASVADHLAQAHREGLTGDAAVERSLSLARPK